MFIPRARLLLLCSFLFPSIVEAQTFNPDEYWRTKATIQSETASWLTVIGSKPVDQNSVMGRAELQTCVNLVDEIADASEWIEGANFKQKEASDALDVWKKKVRFETEQSLTKLQEKADVINQLESKSANLRRELNQMKNEVDRNSTRQVTKYNDKAAEIMQLDNDIQVLMKAYTKAKNAHAKKIAALNASDKKRVNTYNELISELNANAKHTTSERDSAISEFSSSCETRFFKQNDLKAIKSLE